MSLRPGRPVVPVRQCMFEHCRSTRASPVNIDGQHPRDLCDEHANGVREIWTNRRDAYRVSWGMSSDEKLAKVEAELASLLATYGEPDWTAARESRSEADREADRKAWAYWDEHGEFPEDYGNEPYAQTTQEQAFGNIEYLRYKAQDIKDDGYRAPVVRVKVRTE